MGWAMADERKVTALLRLVKASWRSGRKAAIKSVDDRVGSQDNRTERKAKQIQDASRVAYPEGIFPNESQALGFAAFVLDFCGGGVAAAGIGFVRVTPARRGELPDRICDGGQAEESSGRGCAATEYFGRGVPESTEVGGGSEIF